MNTQRLASTLLTATLAGAAFIAASFAAPTEAAAQNTAVVVTDLNVRTGPGTGYPRIRTLPGGTSVQVEGCTPDNWCEIVAYRVRGWVSGNYLDGYGRPSYQAAPPPAIIIQPYPEYRRDWRHDRRYDRRHDRRKDWRKKWRRHSDDRDRDRKRRRRNTDEGKSRFNKYAPCPTGMSCETKQQ